MLLCFVCHACWFEVLSGCVKCIRVANCIRTHWPGSAAQNGPLYLNNEAFCLAHSDGSPLSWRLYASTSSANWLPE